MPGFGGFRLTTPGLATCATMSSILPLSLWSDFPEFLPINDFELPEKEGPFEGGEA